MSNLKDTLAKVEASLGRLVTCLDNEGPSGAGSEQMAATYGAACVELEAVMKGVTVLPESVRTTVGRIGRLQALAKHSITSGLQTTSTELTKVRAARTALGRNARSNSAALGATGIDCNISG